MIVRRVIVRDWALVCSRVPHGTLCTVHGWLPKTMKLRLDQSDFPKTLFTSLDLSLRRLSPPSYQKVLYCPFDCTEAWPAKLFVQVTLVEYLPKSTRPLSETNCPWYFQYQISIDDFLCILFLCRILRPGLRFGHEARCFFCEIKSSQTRRLCTKISSIIFALYDTQTNPSVRLAQKTTTSPWR